MSVPRIPFPLFLGNSTSVRPFQDSTFVRRLYQCMSVPRIQPIPRLSGDCTGVCLFLEFDVCQEIVPVYVCS